MPRIERRLPALFAESWLTILVRYTRYTMKTFSILIVAPILVSLFVRRGRSAPRRSISRDCTSLRRRHRKNGRLPVKSKRANTTRSGHSDGPLEVQQDGEKNPICSANQIPADARTWRGRPCRSIRFPKGLTAKLNSVSPIRSWPQALDRRAHHRHQVRPNNGSLLIIGTVDQVSRRV